MRKKSLESSKSEMKKCFLLSSTLLFICLLLMIKIVDKNVIFIVLVFFILFFYVAVYKLKSAFWHLLVYGLGGGSVILLSVMLTIDLTNKGKFFIDNLSLSLFVISLMHVVFGFLYVFLVDIPAWKKSEHLNLMRKIDVEKGSFDIAFPWSFIGAATISDRTRATSYLGLGASLGPVLAIIYGVGFIYFIIISMVVVSAIMFWHRVYFAGLLIWLGKKNGKPILLSIYR